MSMCCVTQAMAGAQNSCRAMQQSCLDPGVTLCHCICQTLQQYGIGLKSTGFVQKNPFKIHKLFTNLCNMGQKSNSAAHLVKGHNPYCSQRLMHSNQSKLIGSAYSVIFHSIFFKYFFKLLFGLGKCRFQLIS